MRTLIQWVLVLLMLVLLLLLNGVLDSGLQERRRDCGVAREKPGSQAPAC